MISENGGETEKELVITRFYQGTIESIKKVTATS